MLSRERSLIWIGVITWLIVAGPTVAGQIERYGPTAPRTVGVVVALVAFLAFFLLLQSFPEHSREPVLAFADMPADFLRLPVGQPIGRRVAC